MCAIALTTAGLLSACSNSDGTSDGPDSPTTASSGVFPVSEKGSVARAEVPIKLRGIRELGDICCWAAPIWLGWALYRLLR